MSAGHAQIEDCTHDFFTEHRLQQVMGPCARQGAESNTKHRAPFTRCRKCGLVLCFRCAGRDDDVAEERVQSHKVCAQSGAFAGHFVQHPKFPLVFYVLDRKQWSKGDKLAWLKQELAEIAIHAQIPADLATVAAKFVELFGHTIHDEWVQKTTVLELYALYTGSPRPPRECALPPDERVAFQRVWDDKKPSLCVQCGKLATFHTRSPVLHYCSARCQYASDTRGCKFCDAVLSEVHPWCTACQRGISPDDMLLFSPALQKKIGYAQRVWFSTRVPFPDYEPAWKKQRRS